MPAQSAIPFTAQRFVAFRRLVFAIVAVITMTATGCSDDPKKQIVGKWEPTDSSDVQAIEFEADGKLKVHLKGDTAPVEGTYELEGGKNLKVKVRKQIESRMFERAKKVGTNAATIPFWMMSEEKATEVTLTGAELTLKDGDKNRTFKRVK